MIVQRILILIERLKQSDALIACDDLLCDALITRFSARNPQDTLLEEDLTCLIDWFAYRWQEIQDSPSDYTLNPLGTNVHWIAFAKSLASVTDKSYLNVLIPSATNTIDFNNLSLLSETTRLENFYLGHDKAVLYRKRALCEHLIKVHFKLSTCRDIHTRKLSAMSINELSRLQSCQQPNGAFSIENEHFISFWDFLEKKTFTRLQAKGGLPHNVIPCLLGLIQQYHHLKARQADFKLFKRALENFLTVLYRTDIDNVNYFYGLHVHFNNQDRYLLHALVVMHQAKTYDIDLLMNDLAICLSTSVASDLIDLNPMSQRLSQGCLHHPTSAPSLPHHSESDLLPSCFRLVISLLTTPFSVYPFMGSAISLWDKTNTVFSEAATMYHRLLPFIESDDTEKMLDAYRDIMRTIVKPANADTNFFTRMMRFDARNTWYRHVEDCTLSKMGVFYFEPEILLHTLSNENTDDPIMRAQIHLFLDELVHTYSQNNSNLLKILRVNVLFAVFLKQFAPEDQEKLLFRITSSEAYGAKIHFNLDVMRYIARRLERIESIQSISGTRFFSASLPVEQLSLFFFPRHHETISQIIDGFKEKLHAYNPKPIAAKFEQMMAYLIHLNRPILTVLEREEVDRSVRMLDYLNAPT